MIMLRINGKRSMAIKLYIREPANGLGGYPFIAWIHARIFLNFKYAFGDKAEGFQLNQLFQCRTVE